MIRLDAQEARVKYARLTVFCNQHCSADCTSTCHEHVAWNHLECPQGVELCATDVVEALLKIPVNYISLRVYFETPLGHLSRCKLTPEWTCLYCSRSPCSKSFKGRTSQCSGTSPSHSTPEGLRRTLGSRPRVTARLTTACFSSSSSAMSFAAWW